jgi:ribosomal protein S18 acetylase RimI-like enzyme
MDMSTLEFRSLHIDDLERVANIESQIAGRPRSAFFEKRLAVATASPESFITCAAMDGGKLLGYGFARLQEGEFGATGAVAVLDSLGVDPDARGKGIGKAVLSGIEQRMKKKGIATLKTQTDWTDHVMTSFFSFAGSAGAEPGIERDTALQRMLRSSSVKMDGWRVLAVTATIMKLADRVLVRSLKQEDLATVVRIDSKLTGRDRSAYYAAKFKEMLIESGIRVSLVAEDDGILTGFVMARVDFGEFGKVEKAAVIDTIGVLPAYKGTGVGHALLSQLLVNLASLQVESLRTQVHWENFALQRFLHGCGFSLSQRLVLSKTVA